MPFAGVNIARKWRTMHLKSENNNITTYEPALLSVKQVSLCLDFLAHSIIIQISHFIQHLKPNFDAHLTCRFWSDLSVFMRRKMGSKSRHTGNDAGADFDGHVKSEFSYLVTP